MWNNTYVKRIYGMWHRINYVMYNTIILTKYLRDVPHLSNHQNVLPSTLQKRNAFSFRDTRVQLYVCMCVYTKHESVCMRVCGCVCVCVCVTKNRERVACTARIDAHVRACALDVFPPLRYAHSHIRAR